MATAQQVKKDKAKSFDKSEYQNNLKDFFREFPVVKWILIGGALYGAFYLSGYLMNASADTIRAYKNLRRAMKE